MLKIRNESLPLRCEICHREDYFDPERNYCARCVDLQLDLYRTALGKKLNLDTIDIGTICGAIAGILFSLLIIVIRGIAAIQKPLSTTVGLAIFGALIGSITSGGINRLRNRRPLNRRKLYPTLHYIDRRALTDGLMVVTITVGLVVGIWVAIISMNSWLLILLLILSMLQLCRQ
jgi:hypothetical protein